MNKTNIQWCDFSSNPLKYRRKSDGKTVWGCVKTSPGCARCYSEQIALRYDRGKIYNAKSMEELQPFMDEAELRQLITRKTCDGAWVSGSRVFVGDMTDLFGEWVPDELLDELFAAFALRPDVTFQVLTKRAERMADYSSRLPCHAMRIHRTADDMARDAGRAMNDFGGYMVWPGMGGGGWPLPNVWLGVSVEDQQRADERIPHLLKTPAAVRFLSIEPLLGPVDLERWIGPASRMWDGDYDSSSRKMESLGKLGWTIVGGESGHGARPCEIGWIRSLVQQCQAASVPCFVKQLGASPIDVTSFRWIEKQASNEEPARLNLMTPDGKCAATVFKRRDVDKYNWFVWDQDGVGGENSGEPTITQSQCEAALAVIRWGKHPLRLLDKKGGTMEEWPEDIRVREFPQTEKASVPA